MKSDMQNRAPARRVWGFLCGAAAMALLAGGPALAQSVYVPNNGALLSSTGNTVSIIDASGLTVGSSTITTGTGPSTAAVFSDQSRVYTPNFAAGTVSVIDTKTNTVTSTITVGTNPFAAVLSPDNKTLYVSDLTSGTVSVISTASNTVTSTITLAGGLRGLALSSDGSTLYVANGTTSTVSVINTASKTVTSTISGVTTAYQEALTPDGSKLYVTSSATTVAVINTATNSIAATVTVGTAPSGLAVSPDGSKVYVANNASNTVSIINTATNTVTATVATGTGAFGVAFSPDGTKAFVTNGFSNTVTVINTATNAVIATLTVGSGPAFPGVCGNGNSLLASGQTFTANSSGALSCTLSPTTVGPVFTGGTLLFNNPGITGTLPITVLSQGAIFDTSGNNATLSGTISGTGGLTKNGLGTLTLSGAGTYSGATLVNAGTLQAGANNVFSAASAYTVASGAVLDVNSFNESVGSIAGAGSITLGSGSLTTGANNSSTIFSGVISGSGGLTKTGSGTLTLSGVNTYSGPTTISGGQFNGGLIVTGSVASSTVTVGSGSFLAGSGTVGTTTIANGGLLLPGQSSLPSSLTISGSLTMQSGSSFGAVITPAASNSVVVTGKASVDGTVLVSAASGTYAFNTTYPLIKASGGVSGTFASLQVSGLGFIFRPTLAYDANDVYLVLAPNALSTLLNTATPNQKAVASAIDNVVLNKGIVPTGGFLALYNLSGAPLAAALDQISGQIGPNVANSVASNFMPFLDLMLNQDSWSDDSSMTLAAADGTGSIYDAPKPAQMDGDVRLWGGGYGGHTGYAADPVSGGAALSATNAGVAFGAETTLAAGDVLAQDVTFGASLAVGQQFFRSGNGHGSSTDVMIGLYGHTSFLDAGYIAASLAVGQHDIKTSRTITVSGTDILNGKFKAHQFGGRVETGYHVKLDSEHELTPFAALAGEDFQAPAYAESAAAGAGTFALTYSSHNTGIGHGELGARFGHAYVAGDTTYSELATVALSHAFDNEPFAQASFQGLPGASFLLKGVHVATDTALLGLDLGVKPDGPLSYGLKVNAQVGSGTTVVQELATLGLTL